MTSKDRFSNIDVQGITTRAKPIVTSEPPLNKKWLDTLLEAKAKQSIGAADAARNRAQTAWGIASAVALAIIGTGILTGINEANAGAQIVGAFALLLWAVASSGYLWAVGMSGKVTGGDFKGVKVNDAVTQILEESDKKRASVVNVTRGAMIATALAMLFTFIAFVIWVHWGDSKDTDEELTAPLFVISQAQSKIELPETCTDVGDLNVAVRGELVADLTGNTSIAIQASGEDCFPEDWVISADRSALLYVKP